MMLAETTIALIVAAVAGAGVAARVVAKPAKPKKLTLSAGLFAKKIAEIEASSVRVTGEESLEAAYIMARRSVWGHVAEGGALKILDSIMQGWRPPWTYWDAIVVGGKGRRGPFCNMPDVPKWAPPTLTMLPYDVRACVLRFLAELGPPSAWEKSRLLWNVAWRHIIRGFNLVGEPPSPEEMAELQTILIQACLSEIDPVRVADPSQEARLDGIVSRAKQAIYWPECGDMEGCLGHRAANIEALEAVLRRWEGEERIRAVATWTGELCASRIRTLEINLPKDFGELITDVAGPAFISGVELAFEIWGAIAGDEFEWEFSENAYTEDWAGDANEGMAIAQGVASEAGETAESL